ncbi:amidinotransferase [Cryomorpha ignava]|uniref:arginine deiminase n=1 Tax=Cryomorpha ignava TaxID=101383 RepID=A0A7K3WNV3_9FLAO|nr:arginine deiminase family protein [Cryomorpha ignava]NEN23174.1 amidinotransferase [Cryomorpha ignava]
MIDLHIKNETSKLEAVVLGVANSPGSVPTIDNAYDPKSKEFIRKGQYPTEEDTVREMDAFANILTKYGVKVYRPEILEDLNQIFTRDICFVIDNMIVVANVLKERDEEVHAIDYVFDQINPNQIIEMPDGIRAEGGDVMPWNGKLFIGYSEPEDFNMYQVSRTNREGVDFLKNQFPHYEVHAFELVKSDDDPRANALHLDCCFQPIGKDQAIIFPGGFKNQKDVEFLRSYFGEENIIEITREEMYNMYSNVFSISPEVIVSEKNFTRLNTELRKRGFTVEEVPYGEISKQEGLLRCSTLPLRRTK